MAESLRVARRFSELSLLPGALPEMGCNFHSSFRRKRLRFSLRWRSLLVRHAGESRHRAPVSVHGQQGVSPCQACALRPVTEQKGVTARWGPKQWEVNDQSVG